MDKEGPLSLVFSRQLFAHGVLGPLLSSALALFLVAVGLVMFTPIIASNAATLAFAIFVYFIVPGYCVLLNFELDGVERVFLGIAVSVAIVPFIQFFLNQAGVLITPVTTLPVIAAVAGSALAWRFLGRKP